MDQMDCEHQPPSNPMLSVIPQRFTKTIHLIRHGEGFHNVAGMQNHDNYRSAEWFDAHLTEKGWDQAVGCFSKGTYTEGNSSGTSTPPLMLSQEGVPLHRVKREAASAEGLPQFVAYEPCREIIGQNPCDKRRPTSHYKAAFPYVDFSLVTEETDVLWTETREMKEDIMNFGAGDSTVLQGDLHRWFENCEMRTIVLADRNVDVASHCETHFAGGHHV
eukprot:gene17560-23884_t